MPLNHNLDINFLTNNSHLFFQLYIQTLILESSFVDQFVQTRFVDALVGQIVEFCDYLVGDLVQIEYAAELGTDAGGASSTV